MKVDDLFFLVFSSNWAGVFVKLKLKSPFKNPGSATDRPICYRTKRQQIQPVVIFAGQRTNETYSLA